MCINDFQGNGAEQFSEAMYHVEYSLIYNPILFAIGIYLSLCIFCILKFYSSEKKPSILCDRCLSLIWIHLVIYSILLMTFKNWNNCLEKFFALVAKRTSFLPPIMYKLTISLKTR